MAASVSISITSAIVYIISGLVFFGLVFLLVMMGVTNCNWECEGGSVFRDVEHKKEEDIFKTLFTFSFARSAETSLDYIAPETYIFLNSEMPFTCFIQFAWKIFQTHNVPHFLFSVSQI